MLHLAPVWSMEKLNENGNRPSTTPLAFQRIAFKRSAIRLPIETQSIIAVLVIEYYFIIRRIVGGAKP